MVGGGGGEHSGQEYEDTNVHLGSVERIWSKLDLLHFVILYFCILILLANTRSQTVFLQSETFMKKKSTMFAGKVYSTANINVCLFICLFVCLFACFCIFYPKRFRREKA